VFHSILAELHRRYQSANLSITGSFYFLGALEASCLGNYVKNHENILCTSAAISNDDASFMYELTTVLKPKRILVIGNAYGFSTVLLSIMCPSAKLVAFDKFRISGIKLTNSLLDNPEHIAVKGSTPEDIASIIRSYLGGECDLVLVDAVHTNEVQTSEFEIYSNFLSSTSAVLFHDILTCNLLESFNEISAKGSELDFFLLTKSVSGLGVALKGDYQRDFLDYCKFLSSPLEETFELVDFFHRQRFKSGIYSSIPQTEILLTPPHPQS
jgi:hypothetical protein